MKAALEIRTSINEQGNVTTSSLKKIEPPRTGCDITHVMITHVIDPSLETKILATWTKNSWQAPQKLFLYYVVV